MIITTDIIIGIRSKQVELVFKSVWEKSPFLANFRLLLKRKILLNQGLLIPRFRYNF